jgi:hypothetical protein
MKRKNNRFQCLFGFRFQCLALASQNLFKGGKGGKKGDHLTRSYELSKILRSLLATPYFYFLFFIYILYI